MFKTRGYETTIIIKSVSKETRTNFFEKKLAIMLNFCNEKDVNISVPYCE